MTREDVMKALHLTSGGKLSEAFNDLISCDFIRKYSSFGNKSNGAMYQLTDLYTLFYLHYIRGKEETDEHLWSNMIDSPSIVPGAAMPSNSFACTISRKSRRS